MILIHQVSMRKAGQNKHFILYSSGFNYLHYIENNITQNSTKSLKTKLLTRLEIPINVSQFIKNIINYFQFN